MLQDGDIVVKPPKGAKITTPARLPPQERPTLNPDSIKNCKSTEEIYTLLDSHEYRAKHPVTFEDMRIPEKKPAIVKHMIEDACTLEELGELIERKESRASRQVSTGFGRSKPSWAEVFRTRKNERVFQRSKVPAPERTKTKAESTSKSFGRSRLPGAVIIEATARSGYQRPKDKFGRSKG